MTEDSDRIEQEIRRLRGKQQEIRRGNWQFNGAAINKLNELEQRITALKLKADHKESLKLRGL